MKIINLVLISVIALVASIMWFSVQKPSLATISQSERCSVMLNRRDMRQLPDLRGKTKQEVREILGDPQNSDQDAAVWLWLFDWDEYKKQGLSLDWKSMVTNSSCDGLWISFDSSNRSLTAFPYSFSAWNPLEK